MKSLEEAIKHCEEVAEKNEASYKAELALGLGTNTDCKECAKEHRQLAEWLEELKAYREKLTEIEMAVNFYMTCETCQGFREYSTSEFVNDLVRILEVNADE